MSRWYNQFWQLWVRLQRLPWDLSQKGWNMENSKIVDAGTAAMVIRKQEPCWSGYWRIRSTSSAAWSVSRPVSSNWCRLKVADRTAQYSGRIRAEPLFLLKVPQPPYSFPETGAMFCLFFSERAWCASFEIRYSDKEKPRRINLRGLRFLAEKEGFEPSRPVIFDLHP